MYCHGLISLLMVASVVSLSVKSNVPDTSPPPIPVDNDARVGWWSSIKDQFTERLNRQVIANSAKWWPENDGGEVDINIGNAETFFNPNGVLADNTNDTTTPDTTTTTTPDTTTTTTPDTTTTTTPDTTTTTTPDTTTTTTSDTTTTTRPDTTTTTTPDTTTTTTPDTTTTTTPTTTTTTPTTTKPTSHTKTTSTAPTTTKTTKSTTKTTSTTTKPTTTKTTKSSTKTTSTTTKPTTTKPTKSPTNTTYTTTKPTMTKRPRILTTPLTTTSTKTTTKITTTPPGCTVTNSGSVPLLASLTGSCQLTPVSATTFNLVSPNYPSRYSSSEVCKGWFSTDEPRYVRVTPVAIDIGTADLLSFNQVFQNETSVTNALVGGHLVFPSSSTSMSFLADQNKPGNKFSFDMEVVNSDCHQIINIPPGVTCTLSIPKDYPPGTICEWWIKAPPGKKVRVTFSRFSVGNQLCLEDFMAIDTSGNSRYTNAIRYCGNNLLSPGTVTSTNEQINLLMNGRDGHFGGFDATYTVV